VISEPIGNHKRCNRLSSSSTVCAAQTRWFNAISWLDGSVRFFYLYLWSNTMNFCWLIRHMFIALC